MRGPGSRQPAPELEEVSPLAQAVSDKVWGFMRRLNHESWVHSAVTLKGAFKGLNRAS